MTTFEIAADGQSITCKLCATTSHSQRDVEHHYCGRCHIFHDDLPLLPPAIVESLMRNNPRAQGALSARPIVITILQRAGTNPIPSIP